MVLVLAGLMLPGCSSTDVPPPQIYRIPPQPEIATGYEEKPGWEAESFAVAAANPLAVDAGYQIIRAGGSALDAAIAIQMVLTLVEPQSSGIGGGAFLMYWDGTVLSAYDGRETAPSGVDESLFLDDNGVPLPFREAVHSGLSVGVPGTIAMLKSAHEKHGVLPWKVLFEPAITLAEEGFPISQRLHRQIEYDTGLRNDAIGRAFYYDENSTALPPGYILVNPALAEVLRKVADRGPEAFYTGTVAGNIVENVRSHIRPGYLSTQDMAARLDEDFQREAICTPWRIYTICGFPPPSSGHITIMQILGMLEQFEASGTRSVGDGVFSDALSEARESASAISVGGDINLVDADTSFVDADTNLVDADTNLADAVTAEASPGDVADADATNNPQGDLIFSANWLHRYLEASRLAYADRNRFIADPAFVDAPGGDWANMLNPSYLMERAALIANESMGSAEAGEPGETGTPLGAHPAQPEWGTSHISIIDKNGNALSMTTTIEQVFGSRIMSDGGTGLPGGFSLNNQLTDFSLTPFDEEGRPIANRVQPGKRPRSSMSPTLIFLSLMDDGGNSDDWDNSDDGDNSDDAGLSDDVGFPDDAGFWEDNTPSVNTFVRGVHSGSPALGELAATLGSPGGAGIIHFTAKSILGMYVFGLNAQDAISLPNFANYNGPSVLEKGRFPAEVIHALEMKGHVVVERDLTSGLQAIQRTGTGWFGGADPRREGVVMGD